MTGTRGPLISAQQTLLKIDTIQLMKGKRTKWGEKNEERKRRERGKKEIVNIKGEFGQ